MQSGVGVSPKYAGLLLAILPFAQMLFSPWAGKAVDQSSARLVSTCGLFGAIAGLCLLLGISPDSSVWYYALAFLLMGISLAFIVTPNTQAVMTAIPREYLSLGSSMVGEFRNIGEASSIGIVNVILVMQLHYQLIGLATAEQLTNTFHITVVVFLLLACIAALCSLLRGK